MINGDVQNHGNHEFQDFETFCQTECLRYGGYIYVKCDSCHFGSANSLPIAIWSKKKMGGVFSWFFPLIIPSPIGPVLGVSRVQSADD